MSVRSIGDSSPLSLSKSATTTCSSLLRELQLEQECLDIYRRKVERSRNYKADLLQSLAASEAEIAGLASALGEQISYPRFDKMENLKQQISVISPTLDFWRLKKQERIKEIAEAEFQIARISAEISGDDQIIDREGIRVDELDLTINKLRGLESHLQELQCERNLRYQKVNSHISAIHDLSVVMSLDFKKIMADIHPSFIDTAIGQSKSISNETLARLTNELNLLKKEKQQRLLKLQKLGRTLFELWNLMDTPVEEQQKFKHVTYLTASDIEEVFSQGCLSFDVIEQTEVEVERLNDLKASKMRELIFKRQSELEEIYDVIHMDVDSEKARQILITLLESGNIDLADLLSSMDDQIAKAKEQARSRKDILDKVEKWKHAADEESWLDEYERDENRYSAGRGVHKNLKRAEKARILVSKIPSLVENLTAKVRAWELEKGMPFIYNKAPLLRTLEEFTIFRQEKEEEKRRSREQRKLQEQLATEQEALFGSKSAVKKPLAQSTYSNTMVATPNGRRLRTTANLGISGGKDRRDSGKTGSVIPINYVALPKDDRCS
ncbi:65-kDa microtubule-associated protein 5 isoform X2 [Henckelia pumila]|uniref:65-kDa microtubule-associated protein 5 isoform X2 n=1 Tax=Henckelia pumila TaxID=405737 RepID=UPI003C6E1211